jgi:ABC-type thiamin/hydroxymethylpyrimidine transport system permease subunit
MCSIIEYSINEQGDCLMRFSVRELVYIGIFGALWGAVEITLGSYLSVIGLPMRGTLLTGIGLLFLLSGRLFVPKRGSVLMMGIVTAIVKLMSIGGFLLNPMLAILVESLLAEVGLTLVGQPRRAAFLLAGALAMSWDFFHRFLTQGLIAGRGVYEIYLWVVKDASDFLGIPVEYAVAGVVAMFLLRVVLGLVVGFLAWDVAGAVVARIAPAAISDTG